MSKSSLFQNVQNIFKKHSLPSSELVKETILNTIDHITDGIICTDSDSKVIFANKTAQTMFGYTIQEMQEKKIDELILDISQKQRMTDNLSLSDPEHKITHGKKWDKTTFNIEYSVSNSQSPHGLIKIYTLRDISEFNDIKAKMIKLEELVKKKEAELQALSEQSDALVKKKTEENIALKNAYESLITDQGEIIQKERWVSIGQLSAGIAHEINNPLGFVENNIFALQLYTSKFTEMIEAYESICHEVKQLNHPNMDTFFKRIQEKEQSLKIKNSQADLDKLFHQTQDGINRINTIIKSLKNFSQSEAENELTPFNINVGIANTLVICQNEYKYTADIITDYGNIPLITCAPSKLNQVFLNIIVNASHATKDLQNDKRGEITIKTYQENDHVICKISDNGPGIPDAIKSKIFTPFFTTKSPKIGTGMGLSISYDIIQKHHGSITVESKEGDGATFIIKLPISSPEGNSKP